MEKPPTRKRFGQHFLEPAWVRKLLDVVGARADDVFLEIGPGRGALTLPLASQVARLVAVEIDRDLAADLARVAPDNVEVVAADFLETDVPALLRQTSLPVRVVGNLPYNVSSPILFRLLSAAEEGRVLSDATLMLQSEVAGRLAAPPGGKEYGVLSVLTQLRADVTRSLQLPPGAFRPAPRVSSSVVHLAFRPPKVPIPDPALLEGMVRAIFTQRRKTLANALRAFAATHGRSAAEALAKVGIETRRRPETLGLGEMASLAQLFASADRPDVL